MPLKPETLDKFAVDFSGIVAKMSPEDVEGIKARLASKLNGGIGVADMLLTAIGETEGEPEPVTASGAPTGAVQRMSGRKPTPSPEATPTSGTALLASANAVGVMQGHAFTDKWQLAESIAETLNSLGPTWRGKTILASAKFDYPEDRRLDDSLSRCERLMDAVCSPAVLTATGGICQPVNVDYSIGSWATPERPLKDGLASFECTRGGVHFITPPDIAEWEAATGIWTEATDAEPGSATKPVKSLACGSEETVYIDAVPTRIGFGNMQSRFAPEQVAVNTDLAMAAAARIAENNLLNLIAETALKNVTTATTLGATRDLLTALDQAVANYRQTHRIADAQAITVIFPRWVRDLIRVDLAREIGHSQNSDWNSLAVTDDLIVELLRARGINPIFHLDGQPSSVSGGVAQTFALPVEGSAIKAFPTKCVWYMFAEGMVQFLDGGRLDLGVVRDSTLDATNDFETFVETFEGIANRGFAKGVIQFVSTLCANGASAGTLSTEGHCA
ncbi:MAG: major capsid protein [Solirubrobacteraceae bacterium]